MKKYFLFACVALFCSGATMATEGDLVSNTREIGPAVEETKLAGNETTKTAKKAPKKRRSLPDVSFFKNIYIGFVKDVGKPDATETDERGYRYERHGGYDMAMYSPDGRLVAKLRYTDNGEAEIEGNRPDGTSMMGKMYPNGAMALVWYIPNGIQAHLSYEANGKRIMQIFDKNGDHSSDTIVRGKEFEDDTDEIFYWEDGGKTETRYRGGLKVFEADYNVAGFLDGYYETWHPNGQINRDAEYKDGAIVGKSYTYYPNGKLHGVEDVDKKHMWMYREDGTLASEADIGQFDCKKYQDNQYVKEAGCTGEKIVRSLIIGDGKFITYYSNGQIEEEGTQKVGMRDGIVKGYYESGALKWTIIYNNGVRDGEWKYYYENGNLEAIDRYKNGLRHGQQEWWYEDGQKKVENEFVEGRPVKMATEYYPNGVVKKVVNYDDNYMWLFREDGSTEDECGISVVECSSLDISLMRCGRTVEDGIRFREKKSADCLSKDYSYYNTGELWQELTFKDGKLEGVQKSYCKNGQLHGEATYKDGKEDGDWVIYYDNGQVQEKGRYENGERVGTWEFYDEEGNKLEEATPIENKC